MAKEDSLALNWEDLQVSQNGIYFDGQQFEAFFGAALILPISETVVTRAIGLRQAREMSLGDAIVAATGLVNGKQELTRNVKDFADVPGLIIVDPLAAGDPT